MGVAAAKALLSLITKNECELPELEPALQIRESVERFTES
jgi:DNA-binding LacI/PurR family transcriptional regulator